MRDLGLLSSWQRVAFDFDNYGPLRRQELSHKEAIKELDRIWESRRG